MTAGDYNKMFAHKPQFKGEKGVKVSISNSCYLPLVLGFSSSTDRALHYLLQLAFII